MFKVNTSGSSGFLPPDWPESGPEMTVVERSPAANEGTWHAAGRLARRQRRRRRGARARGCDRNGWTLALW